MKLLVNVSVWSDDAILPDRVIEFNNQEEFKSYIEILLSDLNKRIKNLPNNRVGFNVKSNVSYKFTSSSFENLSVNYQDLFNDSFFEKLLKLEQTKKSYTIKDNSKKILRLTFENTIENVGVIGRYENCELTSDINFLDEVRAVFEYLKKYNIHPETIDIESDETKKHLDTIKGRYGIQVGIVYA